MSPGPASAAAAESGPNGLPASGFFVQHAVFKVGFRFGLVASVCTPSAFKAVVALALVAGVRTRHATYGRCRAHCTVHLYNRLAM